MATIMDEDTEWNGAPESNDRQQVDDYYRTHSVSQGAAPRMKERSQLMRQMINNDWISNIWVMVDIGKSAAAAARELSDTQSECNFVSHHFLKDAGVDLTKIKPTNEEIQGIVPGVTLKPSYQIKLEWVREKGKKMHRGAFFVVDHPDDRARQENDHTVPDYDIIVSKAETASYLRNALVAAGRKQTDAEKKAAQDARDKKEAQQAAAEKLRLMEEGKAKPAANRQPK